MNLSPEQLEFLEQNGTAAMITVTPDGIAKTARVGIVVVDGRIWSSGTADRVRTRRLRSDARCTLFVFDATFHWLSLETTVAILDGPDVVDQSVRMFRVMQDRPIGPLSWFAGELDEGAFRQKMIDEKRLIYEFQPTRAYGLF